MREVYLAAARLVIVMGTMDRKNGMKNCGSSSRFDYTAIGDGVNLAARLESSTKEVGQDIVIGEKTMKGSSFDLIPLESILVKGKEKPVGIYEIIDGEPDTPRRLKEKTLKSFNDGVAYYQAQKFEKAADCFSTVLGVNTDDYAADLYLGRCQTLLSEGWDPATWDGVERLQIK